LTESDQTRLDRIWDIVEKAGVCMMTTRFYGGMRARPMEARPDREEGVIWFLTDQRGLKDDEIDAIPEVCLVFVYPKEKVYLSITGEAFVAHAPDRARALWNERQKVWWSGPDDPTRRTRRAGAGGDVGRPREFGCGCARIRQGAAHRREAATRREPQGRRGHGLGRANCP
jgi:general stress protein 26